jgi:hypothetical protein
VAHTYNPSYLEGRNQEDRGLKSVQANSSREPILKKNLKQKMPGGVAQGVGPELKPSTAKQINKHHKKGWGCREAWLKW